MKSFSPSQTRIHFVGIGGIGMSGIAQVFKNRGYSVSGSDQQSSSVVESLRSQGIEVHIGHQADVITSEIQVLVTSTAVQKQNPEVLRAHQLKIPVIPRAEMLGELMRGKRSVGVAGTHGKTTTTSMLSSVFVQAGLDPTCVIGGRLDLFGGNAKLGQGDWVVAEADESDGSFLSLPITLGIVTNIDADHLDHYGNLNQLDLAFTRYMNSVPFYGFSVVCGEDLGVARILGQIKKPVVTYGSSSEFDYFWSPVSESKNFEVFSRQHEKLVSLGEFSVGVPGRHNLLNALGVIALCDRLEMDLESVRQGLKNFKGAGRRFEKKFEDRSREIEWIDDYGHHPTEVRATLQAAREICGARKLKVVFQPHRFSRTQLCEKDFLTCFDLADEVSILDIYAAGEAPISGIHSKIFTERVQASLSSRGLSTRVTYGGTLDQETEKLKQWFQGQASQTLIISLGAGNITTLADRVRVSLGI